MVGCPKCGNTDIQVMELLAAWKKIDELETALAERTTASNSTMGFTVPEVSLTKLPDKPEPAVIIPMTQEQQDWKDKYDKIKAAYVQTRLDVSGSFGNWDFLTRKRVLEHEISSELGFLI